MEMDPRAKEPGWFRTAYALNSLCSVKTGGTAHYFAEANSLEELLQAIRFTKDRSLPFYLLGNGTNVLISDDTFKGTVLKLGTGFCAITVDRNRNSVTAGAGASLIKLGNRLAEQGYTGYAYMGVIPGTVGGAVAMNAGISDSEKTETHFSSAAVLDPETLRIETYTSEKMNFRYRESALKRSGKIILDATFHLRSAEPLSKEEARKRLKQLCATRRNRQPQDRRTFGSTFKNPPGSAYSAGGLLEKCGMKGMTRGGARISPDHANWIINTGSATSTDIRHLIETGQKRVLDRFGIRLEREVVFLPEDLTLC